MVGISGMMTSHSHVCMHGHVCPPFVCVIGVDVKEVGLERTNMCPNNCNTNLSPVTMTHYEELLCLLFAAPPLQRISVLKLWRATFSNAVCWKEGVGVRGWPA